MGFIKHVVNAVVKGEDPDCSCIIESERDTDKKNNTVIKHYNREVVVDPNCPKGHAFKKGDQRRKLCSKTRARWPTR